MSLPRAFTAAGTPRMLPLISQPEDVMLVVH
jgi:hypothetical protein